MINNTRAINALRQIMHDDSETMSPRRRVEAAEHLLDYECPEAVVVECKEFLTSIFEDDERHVDIRLDALKLMRKFEAAKITPRTIRTANRDDGDRREAWRRYEIAQRHRKLSLAIMDTPPPGWADDLYSDDYVPPAEGWPGPAPQIPLKDLVVARRARQERLEREAIERLRHVPSERLQLLALLASQRRSGNGSDPA